MIKKGIDKSLKISLLLWALTSMQLIANAQDDFAAVEADSISYFDKIDTTVVPVVSERKIDDSVINRLKNDEAFWYANLQLQKPVTKNTETPFLIRIMQQQWVRTMLWLLIAASFISGLIWYLTSFNISLFRKQATAIKDKNIDEIAENIFSIDYEKELAKAVQNGRYNLAVRLLYLQLLTQLSDKGIIRYGQDRTNSDYLMQLHNTSYYKDFFRLTREFEYSWYGQFAVSPVAFETIKKDFETFNQRLRF
jgi:hypothetical protein